MKTKYTPGPWETNGRDISAFPCEPGFPGQEYEVAAVRATIYVGGKFTKIPVAEQQANAHLIAAAPELLEALKSIIHFDGCYEGGEKMDATDRQFNWDALRKSAQLAIAKAEGK